eukprot:16429407-Heterocapsa_arctica.AAC.3
MDVVIVQGGAATSCSSAAAPEAEGRRPTSRSRRRGCGLPLLTAVVVSRSRARGCGLPSLTASVRTEAPPTLLSTPRLDGGVAFGFLLGEPRARGNGPRDLRMTPTTWSRRSTTAARSWPPALPGEAARRGDEHRLSPAWLRRAGRRRPMRTATSRSSTSSTPSCSPRPTSTSWPVASSPSFRSGRRADYDSSG